jgi:hypothetical protein
MKWDVFISHASEDKGAVAAPLRDALTSAGLRVWLDELELTVGDSLRKRIDDGLANSRYGVVILSKAFFRKHWAMSELDGLASRESLGRKVILPVWHRVTYSDIKRRSPLLAAKLAANTADGIDQVVRVLLKAISPVPEDGYIVKTLEPQDTEWSVKSVDSISVWLGSEQGWHASLCFRNVNRRNEVDLIDFLSLTESYWMGVFGLAGCLLGCDAREIEFSRPTKSYVKATNERFGCVYVHANLFGPTSAIREWREIGAYLHFRNWIASRDVDRDRIDLFLMPYAKNSEGYQP